MIIARLVQQITATEARPITNNVQKKFRFHRKLFECSVMLHSNSKLGRIVPTWSVRHRPLDQWESRVWAMEVECATAYRPDTHRDWSGRDESSSSQTRKPAIASLFNQSIWVTKHTSRTLNWSAAHYYKPALQSAHAADHDPKCPTDRGSEVKSWIKPRLNWTELSYDLKRWMTWLLCSWYW